MQVTLYIPKDLEGVIRDLSERKGISVQQVLLSPFRDSVAPDALERLESKIELLISQLDRKIDLLIPKGMPRGLREV